MAKLDRAKWPTLAKAFDDYGHSYKFDDMFDAKVRSDSNYVVLCWKIDEDFYEMADLASDGNGNWEMQNDMFDGISLKQWKSLKITPQCDWFTYDGDGN
ncbi:hypothetical protein EVB32_161 [Rhizobium phage RHph_TM39]|uniref:Uncharacterized protein n=2 Tax=Cuauhnahuacvirus TaxID=3044696 RepID=A0A7S5R7W5_9CAUD|nr:hypothetical protein PQC16_gp161 [Rhizobium phage RHph_TM30]YP_010671309.1 hypothetical protein PQC17_gp160 [Rhizobium phage RHph_Y65]QIG71630.1 hypothetical protein EVB94_159 [Rhizobium phage RHph_TM40]QIG71994.1 hypothetical protein EVB95_160 [Rhizobium phage RHph_TM2_3B]QIG72357.1 hypothetical protein EVB96_161 [Rhizobium phage RHph_TM3_3_6]QIG77149.1 hypothetical protein EVB32_161 [Rhizobium phage RHph_TM39]QIG77483.1 hypothetical protein EVB61_155 [Rhizobium phage RHph_TM21B]